MGVEFMPATIAPEGFQAQEGFIPCRGPELAGAFEAALVLSACAFVQLITKYHNPIEPPNFRLLA